MEAYELVSRQGAGSYAIVWRARRRIDGSPVAIKELKQACHSWEDVVNMKEVAVMRALGSHPNVLRLHAVTRLSGRAYLILDQCDCNVYQVMSSQRTLAAGRGTFSEGEVRWLMRQVLSGLHHMHSAGWMHRDVKPENVLLSSLDTTAKVCDFGQARTVLSRTDNGSGGKLTDYVSTRWYRAPELLLHAPWYGVSVDVWACGCMMAECYTGRPLFAGESELDTLNKAMAILGSPVHSWQDSAGLAASLGIRLPTSRGVGLAAHITRASPAALALMQAMMTWDPAARPSATELLKYPFFTSGPDVPISTLGAASLGSGEESLARGDARAAQAVIDDALARTQQSSQGEGKHEDNAGTKPARTLAVAGDSKEECSDSENEHYSIGRGVPAPPLQRIGVQAKPRTAINPFAASSTSASLPLPMDTIDNKNDQGDSCQGRRTTAPVGPASTAPVLRQHIAGPAASAALREATDATNGVSGRAAIAPALQPDSSSEEGDDDDEAAYVPSMGLASRGKH